VRRHYQLLAERRACSWHESFGTAGAISVSAKAAATIRNAWGTLINAFRPVARPRAVRRL